MRGHMTNDQKQLAFRLKAQGLSLVEIGRQVGCTPPIVGLMVLAGKFRSAATVNAGSRGGRPGAPSGRSRPDRSSSLVRGGGRPPAPGRERSRRGGRGGATPGGRWGGAASSRGCGEPP